MVLVNASCKPRGFIAANTANKLQRKESSAITVNVSTNTKKLDSSAVQTLHLSGQLPLKVITLTAFKGKRIVLWPPITQSA